MDFQALLRHFDREASRVAELAPLDPAAPLPSCPGWCVGTVVSHLAQVYEHKVACTELGRPPDPWPPTWPSGRDQVGWMVEAQARLRELLSRLGPDAPSWTWYPPDQTTGFWARRMAHETAVHRVDVEQALARTGPGGPAGPGAPATAEERPVPPELALDGIDEILRVMLAGDWSDEPGDGCRGQLVAVASAGRSWLVRLGADEVLVEAGGAGVEARLEGDPSDVLLWLWGRRGDQGLLPRPRPEALGLLRHRLELCTQ